MVFEKVRKLLAQQLSIEEDVITMETSFEDLGADSLDVVELVMALEEEFDLQIADEDVENITTVGSIVEYINNRI